MRNVHAFRRSARRFPDRAAVRSLDGTTYTYAELDSRTDALAAALDERLGDGRCAGLLLNGSPAIETMVAAGKRGRANVQLSFRGAPSELASMLETADARGVVFDDANAEAALEAADRADLDVAVHAGTADLETDRDVEDYEAVLADAPGEYDPTERSGDESAILFTSGTTSEPKAVLQDQERAWIASSQAVMEMSLTPEDVLLVPTPWYHDVTTVTMILPALQVGATLVPQPAFDPGETLEAIEAYGVTVTLAVPTQLEAMLEAYDVGDYDLSSLRVVRTGGATVPPSLVERVREHLAEGVHNTYGLTEGFANLTHAYPEEQVENPGTIGHASFAWEEVRVVAAAEPPEQPDPEATVEEGGVGEMIARGPHTDGYIDRPEAEAALFVEDASGDRWLRTGDVVRVDDAGGLHVVDRTDNMVVTGGENVYPQEVERALEGHPDVREVAVVGLSHDRWGQQVAAVVVGATDEGALDRYCLEHDELADFKRPRRYAFADEPLPRSDTGTLLRERIVESYFG